MENILHLITGKTFPTTIAAADAIVLLRDGVYHSLSSVTHDNLYILEDDLWARGLTAAAIKVIDYAQLVGLTTQYKKIITWN